MKVLVTGASGLFGSTLVPVLAQAGLEVITHGRSGNCVEVCNLTDSSSVLAMLSRVEPSCVVNLVAATNVDRCETDVDHAYQTNVRTVTNLVQGVKLVGISSFIHVSTDQVYDSPGLSLEHDVTIRNVYALSKLAGEQVALGVGGTVLRTNFFGPSVATHRSSFSDWVLCNLKRQVGFTVFDDVVFTPLSMKSLAELVCTVVKHPVPGVFNLGSHGAISKADFAFRLAELFNLDSSHMRRGSVEDLATAARRPHNMSMCCDKSETVFGVRLPEISEEIKLLRSSSDAW